MISTEELKIQNREQAGRLLARRLIDYANSKAIVVGASPGGVIVAAALADVLNLPMEVIPCRRIKHPVDNSKSIGSVSPDEVITHHYSYDIPHDYVSHQIAILRRGLQHEYEFYYDGDHVTPLQYKTVILVDDVLLSCDTVIASLMSIKKQNPMKIIVAVPYVSPEAARIIRGISDDFVFVKMEKDRGEGSDYFNQFSKIKPSEAKASLLRNRESHRCSA